ncbi:hypothetical protein UlMin_029056 [Ulmus minor]
MGLVQALVAFTEGIGDRPGTEVERYWTQQNFENHEVKEREGKMPLLTGELQVTLKEGVGTLGKLTFIDNSSWIRSRKFRFGVKITTGYLYKMHYPPALHDEVWRLDRIAKDGALHKKLIKAEIVSVEDFLRLLILGSRMSNIMWENTVEHAKTCVYGGKLYVYYTDKNHSIGIVFNNIYKLRGFIADGQFLSLESLTHSQKVSVDSLMKKAYENWHEVVEYDDKVLNYHTNAKQARIASVTTVADQKYPSVHPCETTQNRQQFVSDCGRQFQTENNQPTIPQLIKFPFIISDQTALMTFNNQQPALPSTSSMDYMSVGTSGAGCSYLPGDWSRPRNGQGLQDIMLESDDMQRLLKTFGIGVVLEWGLVWDSRTMLVVLTVYRRSSGKVVVGWLKLKATLRWGVFVRRRAAERRAQLTELD